LAETGHQEVNKDDSPGVDTMSTLSMSDAAGVVAPGHTMTKNISRPTPSQILPTAALSENDPELPDVGDGILASTDQLRWPEWLRKHVWDLEAVGGSDDFKLVVEKFVKLEMLLGFLMGLVCVVYKCKEYANTYIKGKTSLLSSAHRLDVIGRWISGGCCQAPVIDDLPAFVSAWKNWWASLQPKSRQPSGNSGKLLRVVETGEKWEELHKGSINGFFNVVVSLGWWYTATNSAAQGRIHDETIEDVSWVLDWLLGDGKAGKKCAAADLGKGDKVKRLVFTV
jgi:hypothetical protein